MVLYGVAGMSWRRGFIRLWLVASVIWIAITSIVFSLPGSLSDVLSWRDPVQGETLRLSTLEAHVTATANLRGFALYGIGLPVLALVLGIVVWWVQRGFRPERTLDQSR
jgi:hypothetical protein